MQSQITPDQIYQFILSGGIGIVVAWLVEELRKLIPPFKQWWDALESALRQRVIAFVGFILSLIVYALFAWSGLWPFPASVVEWIALVIALITSSFGTSQFVYQQFLKRGKRVKSTK